MSTASDVGVLIIGQARIGKSFLTNALSGSEFASERSPEPVTTKTDSTAVQHGAGHQLHIFNIPGLIEANKDNMERNRVEVRKAFLQCPTSVVAYVFKDVSGSVSGEAVTAFKAVDEAFVIKQGSLLFIVNEWKGEKNDFEGEARTTAFIHKLTGKTAPVHFVHDYGEKPTPAQMEEVRDGLIVQINRLTAGKHNVEEKPLNLNPTDPAILAQLEANKTLIADLTQKHKDKDSEFVRFQEQTAKDRAADQAALKQTQDSLEEAKKKGGQGGGFLGTLLGGLGAVADTIFGL